MKKIRLRFLVPFGIISFLLLGIFSWFELYNSKREMLELLKDQSHTLLETITRAGENTLSSNDFTEQLIVEDLLATAIAVRDLFERDKLNQDIIEQMTVATNAFRITVFNRNCHKLFQSSVRDPLEHENALENRSPCTTLTPIFSGERDTLLIGLQNARFGSGLRLAVAVAAYGRAAVVVNIDADRLVRFRKEIGFGRLLHKIAGSSKIKYIVLQDSTGIIAQGGTLTGVESVKESGFLSHALSGQVFANRIVRIGSEEVFEAVHPLTYQGTVVGILRTGLDLAPFKAQTRRALSRVIIITLITGLGIVAVIVAVANGTRLDTLRRQYQEVETYVNALVQQTDDAIIVLDESGTITIFNKAAEKLFKNKMDTVIGTQPKHSFNKEHSDCVRIFETIPGLETLDCRIGNEEHTLFFSKSQVPLSDKRFSTVVMIRDITEIRRLEENLKRREQAESTTHFASAVAHEIRNPLNTLSMSLQQLRSDFEPVERKEVYLKLTGLLVSETERINRTVQAFLDFSRPEPLRPESFELSTLVNDLHSQFEATAKAGSVHLKLTIDWNGEVYWDKDKIRQVLINLYRNALDAVTHDGTITLTVSRVNSCIEMELADTGPGIPHEDLSRIFNLYYTTKPGGSGLGLSIVQRIIDEHNGTISVRNDHGAHFTIRLPQRSGQDSTKGAV